MKIPLLDFALPRARCWIGVGEAALAVHLLSKTAIHFRQPGRWGSSGPTEDITGHTGCVNATRDGWTSGRVSARSYNEHRDSLAECIVEALLKPGKSHDDWRSTHNLSTATVLRLRAKESHYPDEKPAWVEFLALDRQRLRRGFNSCHPRCRTLCFPQLVITERGIRLEYSLTDTKELREFGGGASRWTLRSLDFPADFEWHPFRESFADFVRRVTAEISLELIARRGD